MQKRFFEKNYNSCNLNTVKPNWWIKSGFIWIMLFSLFFAFTSISKAQTEPPPAFSSVRMTARPAFEGNFKYGEWLPVYVELINDSADLQASVQTAVQGSGGTMVFSTPVELAAGAHKQVTLYVLPNNFTRQLKIELISAGESLASQPIEVRPNPTVNYLVGILSSDRGALNLLNTIEIPGIKRTKVLIDVPPEDIPEKSEGLRSFDLLVATHIDTSTLTPSQVSAVENWVRQGGRLVIGGGADAQLTVSGFPPSLFPATIETTEAVEKLGPLEEYPDPDRLVLLPGPFVAAKLNPSGGQILAGEEGDTLIHEWTLGKGAVDFISLDPSVAPFDAWNGTTPFWQKLIGADAVFPEGLPTDISNRQQFASNMPYILSNLPILDLPSAKGLAVMLALYILVVGPVNYLILKSKKRLHWAWITIPAITVFFSLASFGLGYILHGTDIFINKISVIQVDPSGDAHFDSFIGVFSPAQTNYQVEVKEGGLLSPLSPYYEPWISAAPPVSGASGKTMAFVQGDPAYVEGLSVDQWSMQSFMSEGSIDQYGGIQSDLKLDNDRISGTVTNNTSHEFQDAMVVIGTKFHRIGPLAQGESAEIEIDLSDMGSPTMGMSISYSVFEKELNDTTNAPNRRRAEAKRAIVENIFERTPPMLSSQSAAKTGSSYSMTPVFVGWQDQAPPEVSIMNTETASQTTAVVLQNLDYGLSNAGQISLPPGMIPGKLVSYPRDGGTCGSPGSTGVYMTNGEAIFEYYVPENLRYLPIDRLKLGVYTDSGVFIDPKIEIYDWESESWTQLDGIVQGVNLLPGGSSFIREDGQINLRLNIQGGQSCIYLSVGMESLLN